MPSIRPPAALIPTIVLVGLPNVGKSTLFNRLCESRRALMSDIPGTTRDWQEGMSHWNGRTFRVVDTGGYAPGAETIISAVRAQVEHWVKSADVTVWVVDGLEGLTSADESLSAWMRSRARNVIVVVNKTDDAKRDAQTAEFYRLGFPTVIPLSAVHGRKVNDLLEKLEEMLPPQPLPAALSAGSVPTVAILGRPNVGKSSLLNNLLGQERMIVSPIAGTTRDAVDTLIDRDGKKLLFIDTAGLRAKKSKSSEGLEGLTRIMAEKALTRAEVAILLLDASEGILDGDIAVGRLIDENKRACVVGVNKWDLVKDHMKTAQHYRDAASEDLPFMAHAPIIFLSAKTGQHVPALLDAVADAHASHHRRFDDEELTAFFWSQVQERPYSQHGRKLVFHSAGQVDAAPLTFLIRTNMPEEDVHFSYQRRLENVFRKKYGLAGAPVIFRFRRGKS